MERNNKESGEVCRSKKLSGKHREISEENLSEILVGSYPDALIAVSHEGTVFQQLDASAARRHPGTGLGLALTKRIEEAMGGTVGVRSRPAQGSVFHAVLAVVFEPPAEAERGPRHGENPRRPMASLRAEELKNETKQIL